VKEDDDGDFNFGQYAGDQETGQRKPCRKDHDTAGTQALRRLLVLVRRGQSGATEEYEFIDEKSLLRQINVAGA
jgi:hypothetical protein